MRLVWMIGILVLLAGAGWSTGLTGWLHTNGREVLDDANHPVRFCGVNVSGMEYGTGVPFAQRGPSTYGGWATPDPRMYDHLQAWGVNVVRLPIAWANLEPKAPVKHQPAGAAKPAATANNAK